MAAARCPPAPHRLSPSSGRAGGGGGGGGGCGVGGHGGEERRSQGRSRAARRGASPGCYGRQAAGGGRRAGYGLSPELPRTRCCPALSAGGAEQRGPRSEVLRAGATGLNGTGCNLVFWGQEEQSREPGLVRLEKMLRTGFNPESQESSSLLQTAVSVLQSCYLDSTSQDGFQYSQAILVENAVFLNELKAFVQAKEAAGYSQEELEETFAFLLFDNEEEAKEVCQTGLRVNSSSISMLGDPAKGVYISKYADCLLPRPWYHGKSGYIVICKLIKGKVKVVSENYTTSYTCPSPGYDCHVAVSKNIVPSKASPCQAFEQSQYYVYEVSDGSAAERPRQICPYIVITCQYREPKEMPVLARESLPEPNHKAFYCPWRGQLSIRGQLLCNIALRTPYSSTIPAQLPPNLDINHVMGLSDLKKKLPEAAFGKRNYIENEVCFQGVYFSLYEVEIANKDQHKMNQLLENLKKRDLAIIKYLQDQGVLILLTSSALARDDGFDPKEPVSLLALFLFTSSRAVCLRAEEHDPKDERRGSDVSLKIASVLPGLRYALQKATTSPRGDALSTDVRIKQHFQEYAKLEQKAQHTSGQNDDAPCPSHLPPAKDECTKSPTKSSEQSFCQLQHYLADPSSYTLEMSAALGCLAGAAPSLCCSSEAARKGDCPLALPPDPAPPVPAEVKLEGENPKPTVVGLDWSGEGSPKDVSSASELWMQQNKRKSSQTAGTSTGKKWSPLKMQIHSGGDGSRDRKATKKKITFSFPKKTGLTASSSEPMLKLANLEFPHRRKRGAEVLSAEFVHNTQPEPAQKETSAPDSPGLETKRPKTLKNSDLKKVPAAETSAKPLKSKVIKSVASSPLKPAAKKTAESEGKEPFATVPSEFSSQSPAAESQMGEIYPGAPASQFFDPKGNDYESHALNLLADLALGSCIPSFIPGDSGAISSPCSPPRDPAKEQQGLRKQKSSRAASDHEYHRVDKLAKGAASPGKASPNLKLPPAAKTDLKDPLPGEKNPGIASKKINPNPNPAKTRALLPRETQEAAEANKHSFISSEHSYASLLPENLKKPPYPKTTSYSGPALARNGTRGGRAGPLVGKVLPFRHQQSSAHPQPPAEATAARCRGCLLSPRLKEDFAESHSVKSSGKTLQVTRRWEAGYLFSSDSKYTNDELEKTVIRALHGPWDPELPDDVEEMKLILHMWVALFYSKPSKVLSSRRKVVEHSNPKKFVSLNSTGDFLELSDDGEDCFGSEPCPVDSQSEPEQAPSSSLDPSTRCQGVFRPEESLADSTVSSSSGELPPGEEEPSSTSSESLSLADRAARSNLAEKCRQLDLPEEEHGCDGSIAAAVELPREGQKDASITPNPSNDASTSPAVLGREKPRDRALNFSPAPQRTPHGRGEQPESGASRSTSSEANPSRAKPEGLGGEGRASQDPSARPKIEEEEVEEGEAEEEGSGHGSTGVGTSGLAFSGRGDADAEQQPVNLASPRDFGVPGEGPEPIPAASALPREGKSMPALFGTGAASRGLSGGTTPSADVLQEPWGALATPGAEKNSTTLPHEATPAAVGDSSSVPPLSPAPSTHLGVPTAGSGAGEALRGGLGQENEDRAPSAESLLLVGSQAAATAGLEAQGQAQNSSPPGSSSACRAFLDRAAAVGAAPGVQEAAALVQAPRRSSPGGRSCLPQGCGGEIGAELASGSSGESKQEQNKALVEGQGGSTPASHPDVLGEPSGAGDGHGFAFDCTTWAGDSKPDSSSLAACTASAAAPLVQEPPRGADAGAPRCFFGQNERGAILCPPGKPCEPGAAAELSAAAEIPAPGSSLKPGFAGEVKKDPGLCRMEPTESSPRGVLTPGEVEPAPCSPPRSPEAIWHGAEPESVLGAHPDTNPAPCGATTPCFGGQQPLGACHTHATPQIRAAGVLRSHEEDSEGGSSVPRASPAALPAESVPPRGEYEAEEPGVVTDLHHTEVEGEEGAIPVPPWGCFAPISPPLTPSRGARTKHDDSSSSPSEAWGSPSPEENLRWAEPGEPSGLEEASSRQVPPYVNITDSRGVSKDFLNFTVTKKTQRGRRGNERPSRRRRPRAGTSHLLRALLGPRRGREEITQHTLDMEQLRFHYKLNQILRRGRPPLSTSESIFPRHRSLQAASETFPGQETPLPPSPRSRSPLQVTILPSTPWPDGFGCPQPHRDPSSRCPPWHERSRKRDLAAPFHLSKLKYEKTPQEEPPGAASAILNECPQLDGVMLSGVETRGEDKGKGSEGVEDFGDLVAELCGSLRGRLRSVAEGACGSPGMFYLVETGEEPFFARVKTLLKKDGHVEMEPLSFCSAKRPDSDRLLVVIRNEDISSHIHKVPCLLSLKHCPNVAFAGVDSPEDITVHTYQELFHTGGFVVSDDKVLETVTPGQLKEVVKVLEKLNGSGRWKWLLHYKESKKLQKDVRWDTNAQKKSLILKSCQGAELIEVLHYHACDSRASPSSEYVKCLLNLQVQHVSARFAVYLTEKPGASRELFESKGILVADVNTFLGTVQKVAAPFRRSYW
ncbi:protein TASOR 2 isoform X2 [Aythya fuligula]|uniref:Protein TASOR 2 isoform X1 n=1 Tax=Aythya fuligula TaxID=219594 RepID=A0A6J3EII0_AYTFU|nr:protein TASOR 2 isoform X1 [Aythya fuligula]XP_032063511.1 protein TASOR 2 isoform X2 [Aythya fuligula]